MISTQDLITLFTKKKNVNRRTAIPAKQKTTTIATNTIATNTDTNIDTTRVDNIVYTPSTRNRNPVTARTARVPAPTQSTSTKTKSTSTVLLPSHHPWVQTELYLSLHLPYRF